MFNARYDFPAFSGCAFYLFLNCKAEISHLLRSMALYLCSISRFLGAFIMDSPSRYYATFLYIVILNGGKGVSLGESFLDT